MTNKSLFESGFFSGRAFIAVFLCAAAACSILTGTLRAFFHADVNANVSRRGLTFADRVAYQRAIEETYWRHRIWPKENAKPKPLLDEVMSAEQIEKKVEDYLRNSQALETYWQRPITHEQLQAEMERMARNTKQSGVLRELFEALGNDPSVIAECLAKPVLTQRLMTELSANDKVHRFAFLLSQAAANKLNITALGKTTYTLPEIDPCSDDTWTATGITNVPSARESHTTVWTGSEMIVWGGFNGSNDVNTGGRYNPATDSWTATSTTNAPASRDDHTAVWTGSEMIVWGGFAPGPIYFNTGGRYNPGTDTWAATSMANVPEARELHKAVWTGSEMIVWGGFHISSGLLNTGGRYNPGTNSWVATNTTNAPAARRYYTAVWTGNEMIVWGGLGNFDTVLNTGGTYNPGTDTWVASTISNAPSARWVHTAVWTGSEMIVWGGSGYPPPSYFSTGGRYNPTTNTWTATNTTAAPTARWHQTAVWTGNEMIAWGGQDQNFVALNTGGRYDPSTDNWLATNTTNAPAARKAQTAVWTGSEMIVWGGDNGGIFYLNTGGRYCAELGPSPTPTPTATPTPTPTPCTGRCAPTPRPRPTPVARSTPH